MRPVYLKFCGIKSFSSTAEIDFEKLLRGGIFGIFGDTGAGKSTILDSLSFALYGRVNRIGNGKDGTSTSEIINYNSDKATVCFDFESEWQGERHLYRVERTLPRKGAPKAVLYRKERGEFYAVAETPSLVAKKIEEEILGIGFEDFKKCIALPQGEFSQFLQSSKRDRLELVSKLFSLEEYGYALTQRVNARLNEKLSLKNQAEGQLAAYQDVTEEGIEAKKQRKTQLEGAYAELIDLSEKEDATLAAYGEKLKKKNELCLAEEKLDMLLTKEASMTEKKTSLALLQTAKSVCGIAEEWRAAERGFRESQENLDRLEKRAIELSLELERKKGEILAEDSDGKIEETAVRLTLVENAAADVKKSDALKKNLEDCRAQYSAAKQEEKGYVGFDYGAEKAALEERLNALPVEDNPLDFIGNRLKDVLLQEEYALFVSQLKELTEKYPQITADTRPLIERYSVIGERGEADIVALQEEFRIAAKEKEKIKKSLTELEIKREKYANLQEKLLRLTQEGLDRRAEYEELANKLQKVQSFGSAAELKKRLDGLKERKRLLQGQLEQIQESTNKNASAISEQRARKDGFYILSLQKAKQLKESLDEGGMSEVNEAKALLNRLGDPIKLQRETEAYFVDLTKARHEAERLRSEVGTGENLNEAEYALMSERRNEHKRKLREYGEAIAVTGSAIASEEGLLEKKKEILSSLRTLSVQTGRLEQLKSLVAKDKFMEYVAVEYLQEIASNANNLLMRLTNGRYFLVYGDKNFEVGDNFNEGRTRGAQTLSGGEIFLVSLSLALSLSRAIQQNSLRPIEFFFLDEGFGTLDEELIDTVMESLEKLKSENFSIGIISHVGELKNRLESKILVKKASEECGSTLQTY